MREPTECPECASDDIEFPEDMTAGCHDCGWYWWADDGKSWEFTEETKRQFEEEEWILYGTIQ